VRIIQIVSWVIGEKMVATYSKVKVEAFTAVKIQIDVFGL